MDNVQLVQSLYAAFGRGDINAIVEAYDPNIAWFSNADPALLPYGGERRGLDGVRSFFAKWPPMSSSNPSSRWSFRRPRFCRRSWAFNLAREGNRRPRRKPMDAHVQDQKWQGDRVQGFRRHSCGGAAHFGGDIHSVTVAPSEATARLQH